MCKRGANAPGILFVLPVHGDALKVVVRVDKLIHALVVGRAVGLQRLQSREHACKLVQAVIAFALGVAGTVREDVKCDVIKFAGNVPHLVHTFTCQMYGVELALVGKVYNGGTVGGNYVTHGRVGKQCCGYAIKGARSTGHKLHTCLVNSIKCCPGSCANALVGG